MTARPAIFCLGRYGDVINALPIAYRLRHERPYFVIAQEFASILEGVSYVEPLVYPGDYKEQAKAVEFTHRTTRRVIHAQAYKHPYDRSRTTRSYQTEAWRIAGCIHEFGTLPTVFDRRIQSREPVIPGNKPLLLVSLVGVSSPLKNASDLMGRLLNEFGHEYQIVDLSTFRGERVFDLIGVFDQAALLLSIDTMHLHLARAAQVPVIALVNDEWKGSISPPASVSVIRYAEASTPAVIQAVERVWEQGKRQRAIYHVVHDHGTTERHQRARRNWEGFASVSGFRSCYRTEKDWKRLATDLGDERQLPYLRDVLAEPLREARNEDVILWANSDVALDSRIVDWSRHHVGLFGACSMRRNEEGHMGRDLFAFTAGWLRENLHRIPDYVIGCPWFDLGLAALIRKQRGVLTTKDNLVIDFYPCDATERYALHEPHPSSWAGEKENVYPGNLHNRRLFREWCSREMPTLKL